jgi:hypothetical protein
MISWWKHKVIITLLSKTLFIVRCFTTRISNCRNCQKSWWIFSNISRDVRKKFKNEQLIQILDFQFFPWRKTSDTPSFYSFMNYADFGLGTWHPKTGMYDVVRYEKFSWRWSCFSYQFKYWKSLLKIKQQSHCKWWTYWLWFVLSGADYHHTETLLDNEHRNSEKYWDSRVLHLHRYYFMLVLIKNW